MQKQENMSFWQLQTVPSKMIWRNNVDYRYFFPLYNYELRFSSKINIETIETQGEPPWIH